MYMQPRHYQTARLPNLRYRGWLRSSTYMSTRLLRASTKIHLLHGHVWNHAHQQQTKLKKLPDFFFLFCVEFNETGNAKSGLRQLRFQVSDPVAGFGRTLVEAAKVNKKIGCAASTCFHDGTNFWYFTNFGKKEKKLSIARN